MPESTEETLNVPPFPPLLWDTFRWVGTISLPAWAGFQSRLGAYGSVDSPSPSDGRVDLGLSVGREKGSPTSQQIAAYQHLIDNQEIIQDAILKSVFEIYPQWQEDFGYEDDEKEEYMPDLADANDLRNLIGLSNIHLHREYKDGVSYIGFEFGCMWDDEHGLGAMMHMGRVVDIGGADASLLEWIAMKDGAMVDRDEVGERERIEQFSQSRPPIEPKPTQLDLFDSE